MTKLKKLKLLIKDWAARQYRTVDHSIAGLLQEFQEIEKKEELGDLSSGESLKRLNLKLSFQKKVKGEEIKWRQRSRVKWLMDGDRDSKFFHSFASFRNRTNKIVILMDGDRRLEDKTSIFDNIIQFFNCI